MYRQAMLPSRPPELRALLARVALIVALCQVAALAITARAQGAASKSNAPGVTAANESGAPGRTVTPATFLPLLAKLTAADGSLRAGTHLVLAPGRYELQARARVDSTCGNCEDPNTPVQATLGLRLSGAGIVIEGHGDPDSVVIHTNAGYGILFEDCDDCVIANVTVTGGARDADGNATNAGIVVRRSSVRVQGCRIRDNIGDVEIVTKNVVGIIGIAGREGAHMTLRGNRIVRNSWDGIALYRGAEATIEDNVIDGVDKARGPQIGGGRGVGIGLTWDARATVRRNRVTRYWKGIGIFVDARAEVTENVVEDIRTWGIAYWDAGKGKPVARIEGNVVCNTGACGISLTRDRPADPGDSAPGACRGNVVFLSGQNPKYDDAELYCTQRPIAVEALPLGFTVEGNALAQNRRAPTTLPDEDQPRAEFLRRALPLCQRLSALPHFADSRALALLRDMSGP